MIGRRPQPADAAPLPPASDADAVRQLLKQGARAAQAFGRCSSLSDAQLNRLVAHCEDSVENAADALKLRPWPAWVTGVLFPGRRSRP